MTNDLEGPYLTQEELDAHPEIKALFRPDEKVPCSVLFAAEKLEPTEEDIAWARSVLGEKEVKDG